MADEKRGSLSGLTESEAKEFHGIFVTSFIIFYGDCDRCALSRVAMAAVVVRLP